MSKKEMVRAVISLSLMALLFCAPSSAQTNAGGRYEKDGLSFSYPAGWALTDKSNANLQHLILAREGGSSLVVVIAYRERLTKPEQLWVAQRDIWRPHVSDMARKLGIEKDPFANDLRCVEAGGRSAVGLELSGQLNGRPSTGGVYSLTLGRRYVNLFFFRHDKDEEQDRPGWEALLRTLKVEGPADAPPLAAEGKEPVSVGVIHGRIIRKPQPEYPAAARSARATGQVTVEVVVDENGDVASAKAVAGHPLLRESGERAAKKAKFSPTKICGQPVKVTGAITYNFVLM